MTYSQDNTQEKLQAEEAAKNKAWELQNKAQEAAQAAKASAQEIAQAAKAGAQEIAQTAKEGAQAVGDKVQEATQTASSNRGESDSEAPKAKVRDVARESDIEAVKAKAREVAQSGSSKAQEVGSKAQETGSKVQETAKAAGSKIERQVQATKERLPDTTPTPPPSGLKGGLKVESSAQDLKARLDWGEPALTIVDVRSRDMHNRGHITGAIPIPMNQLVEWAQSSLETIRDIYVYGETDQETAEAANSLRKAGFGSVAELKGGLEGWKAIAGPTDGPEESGYEPGPQATNVVARVKDAMEKQSN